ncbi:hypothetical protein WG922_17735 [Ramlibacter sp. AN1015]
MNFWQRYLRVARALLVFIAVVALLAMFLTGHVPAGSGITTGL